MPQQAVTTGNAYGATVDPYGGQQMPDNSGGYGHQGGGGGGYDDRSASYGGGKL